MRRKENVNRDKVGKNDVVNLVWNQRKEKIVTVVISIGRRRVVEIAVVLGRAFGTAGD